MVRWLAVGLDEALKLTLDRITPLLDTESVALFDSVDRMVSEDLYARVDSPSVDASLKDGYAVSAQEVKTATAEHPVRLRLAGLIAAGGRQDLHVMPKTTLRVLTGAQIPPGANAVVSEEYVTRDGDNVLFHNSAEPGRNILAKGTDVALGKCIIRKGSSLTPGLVGMLAASGHDCVSVVRNPKVAIVATGDEVVAPGRPLPEGKLYASNMTTLGAWCRRYKMQTQMAVVKDDPDEILNILRRHIQDADAIMTSGGAWTGDRDMVAQILERLGWEQIFHRIRIGPGKAVGFGLLRKKPVFILPGGPPSNLMGFLQIALPGLLKLSGGLCPGLPVAKARLSSDLNGRHADWTQFIFGTLETQRGIPLFHALRHSSRLGSMAEAQAIAAIPEGKTHLPAETVIPVQLLA
jgi:molybdopterin molybdotransferase